MVPAVSLGDAHPLEIDVNSKIPVRRVGTSQNPGRNLSIWAKWLIAGPLTTPFQSGWNDSETRIADAAIIANRPCFNSDSLHLLKVF